MRRSADGLWNVSPSQPITYLWIRPQLQGTVFCKLRFKWTAPHLDKCHMLCEAVRLLRPRARVTGQRGVNISGGGPQPMVVSVGWVGINVPPWPSGVGGLVWDTFSTLLSGSSGIEIPLLAIATPAMHLVWHFLLLCLTLVPESWDHLALLHAHLALLRPSPPRILPVSSSSSHTRLLMGSKRRRQDVGNREDQRCLFPIPERSSDPLKNDDNKTVFHLSGAALGIRHVSSFNPTVPCWIVTPSPANRYAILTSRICKWDLIWKKSLCRCN